MEYDTREQKVLKIWQNTYFLVKLNSKHVLDTYYAVYRQRTTTDPQKSYMQNVLIPGRRINNPTSINAFSGL